MIGPGLESCRDRRQEVAALVCLACVRRQAGNGFFFSFLGERGAGGAEGVRGAYSNRKVVYQEHTVPETNKRWSMCDKGYR